MGPYQFDEDGFAEGVGNLRRTELCRLCAEKVLHIWKDQFPEDDFPEKMIAKTEKYLDGDIDSEQLWEGVDDFLNRLDENENPAVAAGYAAMQVPNTALNDLLLIDQETEQELPQDLKDEELDYEDHDSGFFASMAVVFFQSNDDFEAIENRRDFWRWYLTEAVPSSYAAYDDDAEQEEE